MSAELVRRGVDIVAGVVLCASLQFVRLGGLLCGALVVTVSRLVHKVGLAISVHGHGVQADVHLKGLLGLARRFSAVGAWDPVAFHEVIVLRGHHATDSDQHEGKERNGVHSFDLDKSYLKVRRSC